MIQYLPIKQSTILSVIVQIKMMKSKFTIQFNKTWLKQLFRPSTTTKLTTFIIIFHIRVVTTSKLTIFFHPRVVTTSKLTIFFHSRVVTTSKLTIFFHPRVLTTSKLTIFFHPRVLTTFKLTIFSHPLVVTTSGHHLVQLVTFQCQNIFWQKVCKDCQQKKFRLLPLHQLTTIVN